MADTPRGLSALLQRTANLSPASATTPPSLPSIPVMEIAVNAIRSNPDQPRKTFRPEALEELSSSIKAKGILQPIVVRRLAADERSESFEYEIIAGERRWRATQQAGLSSIPALIKDVKQTDEILLLSLIENIQRDDLNPIEEALAYSQLHQSGLTQEMIAQAVSKSRAAVANAIRLLELPVPVLDAVRQGQLSVGHAKVLLSIPNRKIQMHLANKCQAEALSVRQLENLASENGATERSKKGRIKSDSRPAHVRELERRLREHFGTSVQISEGTKKGKITIEFYSVEDFDRITRLMGLK
jgi:ParB family chromosome partitioning protein